MDWMEEYQEGVHIVSDGTYTIDTTYTVAYNTVSGDSYTQTGGNRQSCFGRGLLVDNEQVLTIPRHNLQRQTPLEIRHILDGPRRTGLIGSGQCLEILLSPMVQACRDLGSYALTIEISPWRCPKHNYIHDSRIGANSLIAI